MRLQKILSWNLGINAKNVLEISQSLIGFIHFFPAEQFIVGQILFDPLFKGLFNFKADPQIYFGKLVLPNNLIL